MWQAGNISTSQRIHPAHRPEKSPTHRGRWINRSLRLLLRTRVCRPPASCRQRMRSMRLLHHRRLMSVCRPLERSAPIQQRLRPRLVAHRVSQHPNADTPNRNPARGGPAHIFLPTKLACLEETPRRNDRDDAARHYLLQTPSDSSRRDGNVSALERPKTKFQSSGEDDELLPQRWRRLCRHPPRSPTPCCRYRRPRRSRSLLQRPICARRWLVAAALIRHSSDKSRQRTRPRLIALDDQSKGLRSDKSRLPRSQTQQPQRLPVLSRLSVLSRLLVLSRLPVLPRLLVLSRS